MNDATAYIFLGISIGILLYLLTRNLHPKRGNDRQKRAWKEGISTYEQGGSLKDTWKTIRDSQKKSRL